MKRADALKLLEAGFLGFIAEYRSGKATEIPYVSKQTGKSAVMKKVTHTLEVNGESVLMSESLKDDFDLTKYVPPAKKGDTVLVHMRELENDLGSIRARGKCEVVTA